MNEVICQLIKWYVHFKQHLLSLDCNQDINVCWDNIRVTNQIKRAYSVFLMVTQEKSLCASITRIHQLVFEILYHNYSPDIKTFSVVNQGTTNNQTQSYSLLFHKQQQCIYLCKSSKSLNNTTQVAMQHFMWLASPDTYVNKMTQPTRASGFYIHSRSCCYTSQKRNIISLIFLYVFRHMRVISVYHIKLLFKRK